MSKEINLIFPHQLFAESPLLENGFPIHIIEEFLFFKNYKFHKQKIAFHRASMKKYEIYLNKKGLNVHYIESKSPNSDIKVFLNDLRNTETIHIVSPSDIRLEQRLDQFSEGINLKFYSNQLFLNNKKDNASFFRADKKFFFHSTFYKQQRKRLNILLNDDSTPVGDKWSYDGENRKKYPKNKQAPHVDFPTLSKYWLEAISYVEEYFPDNPGKIEEQRLYPIDYYEAKNWFEQFLDRRFHDFGPYEDAMVKNENILNHSLLSPLINVGLITPQYIVNTALAYAEKNDIPINSTEGFIRQIIGWREFIRGMYELNGLSARSQNHWNFKRKIPSSFYTGETGILPVDNVINQLIKSGYCHHIERLMILGNFMLLCEFHPDEVFRWFMEMFIDSYDWVMVPNVYGMSQFADGGSFATKPYISGSNYIKKMSNFPRGEWEEIWNGLFWRFMNLHRESLNNNPRLSMLIKTLDRMTEDKKDLHFKKAEYFLANLA